MSGKFPGHFHEISGKSPGMFPANFGHFRDLPPCMLCEAPEVTGVEEVPEKLKRLEEPLQLQVQHPEPAEQTEGSRFRCSAKFADNYKQVIGVF